MIIIMTITSNKLCDLGNYLCVSLIGLCVFEFDYYYRRVLFNNVIPAVMWKKSVSLSPYVNYFTKFVMKFNRDLVKQTDSASFNVLRCFH